EVKGVADEGSIKSFGRDADDGEGNAVEPLCLPHDFRIAAEAVFPQLVADDDYGMSVAPGPFLRSEAAPERRTHADAIKIIRGDHAAHRPFSAIADAKCSSGDLFRNPRIDQGGISLKVQEVGPGDVVAIVGGAIDTRNSDQSVLIDDERVGTKENSFDPAEYGSIGADPQGQAQNREERKAGVSPENAQAEAKILHQAIEPHPSPNFIHGLGDLQRVAESELCCVPSFDCRASFLAEVLRFELHMILQLALQFGLALVAFISKQAGEQIQRSHEDSSSTVWSNLAMAPTSFRHFDSSCKSCLRPVAVSPQYLNSRLRPAAFSQLAVTHPRRSRRCSAGYRDPCSTWSRSSVVRWMCRAIS